MMALFADCKVVKMCRTVDQLLFTGTYTMALFYNLQLMNWFMATYFLQPSHVDNLI